MESPDKKRKTRRGKGEGSISQRSDGLWMARIDIGHDAKGKRLRKYIYGKTKTEVATKLTDQAAALNSGGFVDPGKTTVSEFLTKWLDVIAKPNTEPGTYDGYERIVNDHLIPAIGHMKLRDLGAFHVENMLSTMAKIKVGSRTREYCFVILKSACKKAKAWKLVAANPCEDVKSPKVVKRQVIPLTSDQAKTLLLCSKGDRFHAMYVLALTTGMRQGELFGVQWDDLDLTKGVLQVRRSLEDRKGQLRLKEPKSDAGRRQIALSQLAVDALEDRRKAAMVEGLAACQMVFPDSEGGLLRKCSFYRWSWSKIRTASKIGAHVHFHDLRHSNASLLLAEGTNMKEIQGLLGHSTISMTMDTYAHLMPDSNRKSANTFDRLLG
ncbi:MAG TPA: site-specific integrase [Schlesneria sp.]|jgi:integrase